MRVSIINVNSRSRRQRYHSIYIKWLNTFRTGFIYVYINGNSENNRFHRGKLLLSLAVWNSWHISLKILFQENRFLKFIVIAFSIIEGRFIAHFWLEINRKVKFFFVLFFLHLFSLRIICAIYFSCCCCWMCTFFFRALLFDSLATNHGFWWKWTSLGTRRYS